MPGYFPDSHDAGIGELNVKLGEIPSAFDYLGENDSREYSDCSFSAGVMAINDEPLAEYRKISEKDVGKACLVWGGGSGSDDLAVLTEVWRKDQVTTDSYAVVEGSELDCNAAEEIRFTLKSFRSITWEVFGADAADYSDEVSAYGPSVTTADVRQDHTVTAAKRYYRVKAKSTASGVHGNVYCWMAALGRLLRSTVAAVISERSFAIADSISADLLSVRVRIATDNRELLQKALDAVVNGGLRILHIPGRNAAFCNGMEPALFAESDGAYYVSDYLVYRGQHIKGDGPIATIIVGAPGKDIFRMPDPTLNEEGAIDGFIHNPCITQMRLVVDNSVDARSTERPMFPDSGAWQADTFYSRDTWVNNAGNLYYCTTFVNSGDTPPTHTKGNESDGAARWTFVGPQGYWGNAAIAFPLKAPQTLDNYSVIRGYFEYLEFTSTSGVVNEFGSCGIWTQRNLYGCSLFMLDFNLLTGGCIHSVPQNSATSYPVVPDATTYDTLAFVCKYPFISFNSINCEARNLQFYTIGAIDAVSGYLLGSPHGYRYEPSGWSVSNWYCEPGPMCKSPISLIEGYGHRFKRVSFAFGAGQVYTQIDASDTTVEGATIYNELTGQAPFLLYGNRIRIQGQAYHPSNVCEDYGHGNTFTVSYLFTDRAYAVSRDWSANSDFFQLPYGSKSLTGTRFVRDTSCRSLEGCSFAAIEAGWFGLPTGVEAVHTRDATLESNGYVRIKGAGSYTNFVNKEFLRIGPNYRLPACKLTAVFKFRGDEGTNYRVFIFTAADLVGTDSQLRGGGIDEAWDATGDWEIRTVEIDFSGEEDRYISFAVSGNVDADNIDIAWVSFVPHFTEMRAKNAISETLYVGPTPYGDTGRLSTHPSEPDVPTSAVFRANPHDDQATTPIIQVEELDVIGGNPGQVILATATLEIFANGVLKVKGLSIYAGTASPEGAFAAAPGSWFLANISGVGHSYYKASGTGNTGWIDLSGLWRLVGSDTIVTPYAIEVDDPTDSRALGISVVPTSHVGQAATPIFSGGGFQVSSVGRTAVKSLGVNATAPSTDGNADIAGAASIGGATTLTSQTANSMLKVDGSKVVSSMDAAAVRTFADVYSKAEVNALLADKLNSSTYSGHVHDETGTVTGGPHAP